MENNLPKRKSTRLKEYDYSSPGAYFITICTKDRKCLLSEIVVGTGVLDCPFIETIFTAKRYVCNGQSRTPVPYIKTIHFDHGSGKK